MPPRTTLPINSGIQRRKRAPEPCSRKRDAWSARASSIDDSDAELAGDLRGAIRAQVAAGRTDEEIRTFLSARYGDFVLFRPKFSVTNALLWGGPFAIAGLGAVLLFRRRRTAIATAPLSPEEEARLQALTLEEPS